MLRACSWYKSQINTYLPFVQLFVNIFLVEVTPGQALGNNIQNELILRRQGHKLWPKKQFRALRETSGRFLMITLRKFNSSPLKKQAIPKVLFQPSCFMCDIFWGVCFKKETCVPSLESCVALRLKPGRSKEQNKPNFRREIHKKTHYRFASSLNLPNWVPFK